MSEKRSYLRYRVNKTAFLFTLKERTIRCYVTDLSVGGARLALHEHDQSAADARALMMEDEALLYPCWTRWQDNGLVGVRFTGQPELVGAPAEEIARLRLESALFKDPDN